MINRVSSLGTPTTTMAPSMVASHALMDHGEATEGKLRRTGIFGGETIQHKEISSKVQRIGLRVERRKHNSNSKSHRERPTDG